VPIVLKSGSLNLLEPSGPVKACNGIAFTPNSSETKETAPQISATAGTVLCSPEFSNSRDCTLLHRVQQQQELYSAPQSSAKTRTVLCSTEFLDNK
jgi:hypothetical protein